MQWKHVNCPPPKKFRTQPVAGKSYNDNFGDSEEIHMVDYLPSKKTIIGQYYGEIMFKLYHAISQKCRGKLSLSVWLLHDNAPSSQVTCCTASCWQLWISFNWTTLSTVEIWLLATVICSKIWNIIFIGPGLQTMNRQKLLLKHGLKGRTDNPSSSHKQLTRKVAKMHWRHRRLYWKMTLWLKVCGYSLYRSCKTFWSPLVIM